MDPLVLLREYTVQGKPIGFDGQFFTFGDVTVPRSYETWWKGVKGSTNS
jgi:hypothetical protein